MQTRTNIFSSTISLIPPPLQVVIAILSIQLGAAFAVNLFDVFGPSGTVFFRLAISAFLLGILIRPRIDHDVLKHSKLLIIYGVALALMNWCFYEAIARIPLGIAVAIEFMGPLLVGAISSKNRLDYLWIAVAFLGVLILTPRIGADIDPIGVGFAVLAGVGWGGFVILSKQVSKALQGSDGLVFGMIVATIFMLPFAIETLPAVSQKFSLVGYLIVLAVLSTSIPFYLEFSALKKLTPEAYGVLITLEPAAAAVIGMLALGDILGTEGFIAIALVTIAAIGSTLTQTNNKT